MSMINGLRTLERRTLPATADRRTFLRRSVGIGAAAVITGCAVRR
jgi:hypothetical protein